MTPIIIFILIVLAVLAFYTISNKSNQGFEDTFVPSTKVKKFKPVKPKSSTIQPISSGASSGPAKPLGKIEEPEVTKKPQPVAKTDAKIKAKKSAAKKAKKPNNGDQLLHS
jgi:hypothetical protein